MSWTRGEHRVGSSVPLPGDLFAPNSVVGVNVVTGRVDSAMFFAVCDFAALSRAALCAARVEVSAAVSSIGGGIWGRERPPLPPSCRGSSLEKEGVAPAPDACRCRPAEPRFACNIAEYAAGVVRDAYVDFIGANTLDRFSRETAFI